MGKKSIYDLNDGLNDSDQIRISQQRQISKLRQRDGGYAELAGKAAKRYVGTNQSDFKVRYFNFRIIFFRIISSPSPSLIGIVKVKNGCSCRGYYPIHWHLRSISIHGLTYSSFIALSPLLDLVKPSSSSIP